MSMRIFFMLLAVYLMGCSPVRTEVKFRKAKIDKVKMNIPQNYVFEGLQGSHEFEQRYWYSDSSVIYITNFENTINYKEIRQQNTYYDRFNALQSNDTLTLQGVNIDGLYWKDMLLGGGITIGYSRVPQYRVKEFEKAISSAKKLR